MFHQCFSRGKESRICHKKKMQTGSLFIYPEPCYIAGHVRLKTCKTLDPATYGASDGRRNWHISKDHILLM